MAAIEDAAGARVDRTEAYCDDCAEFPDGQCETHAGDRERADKYRRTLEELRVVLGRPGYCG